MFAEFIAVGRTTIVVGLNHCRLVMTNSQSRQTEDCVIGNLHFGLSLNFVPESNPDNILILLCICSANLKFVRPILAIT